MYMLQDGEQRRGLIESKSRITRKSAKKVKEWSNIFYILQQEEKEVKHDGGSRTALFIDKSDQ